MLRISLAIIGLLVCVSTSQASIVGTTSLGGSRPYGTVAQPASPEICCPWFLWSAGKSPLMGDIVAGPSTCCSLSAENDGTQKVPDPEPSTLIIWTLLGFTWAGLKCFRDRRRELPAGLGRGRGRFGEVPAPSMQSDRRARQPWSDHNRAAILEIIGRGSAH